MPNTKSAEKRVNQSQKRKSRNRRRMTAVRENRKEFESLLADNNLEKARESLDRCYSALDKAAKHNTISPNKAARLKARLTRNMNAAAS